MKSKPRFNNRIQYDYFYGFKEDNKKATGESDRASSSIYVSQTILKEFKDKCGKVGHSRVLEELMREFIDDLSSKAKTSILKKATVKKN